MTQTVDIFERSLLFKLTFDLDIEKWDTMDEEIKEAVSSGWNYIKYLDDAGELSKDINNLPNDCGGIYIFLLRPDKIPRMHRYIMYIGRARRATSFGLRQRCRTYISDTRPEVHRMIHRWGQDLYLYYLPIHESDEFISKVERELNRVIIPPCNSQIPDYHVMPGQNLF